AILVLDLLSPEPPDRVGEVEVDAVTTRAHAPALVAHPLGGTTGDVTRHEVAEPRVLALEVVVALVLGDLAGAPPVARRPRHPYAAVVAQRLAHQRELRLMLTGHRNAGGVDLGEARVAEGGALLVGAPDGGGVAALGVGGEEEDVAVAARRQQDGVTRVAL